MGASASTPEEIEPLDRRDRRALTEAMTVLPAALDATLEAHEFRVVTPSGDYRVDVGAEACDCPDALHRGARCKHLRRVDFARGVEAIPEWVNREAVDDELGQHVGDAGVSR